jgi:hypothetical protein
MEKGKEITAKKCICLFSGILFLLFCLPGCTSGPTVTRYTLSEERSSAVPVKPSTYSTSGFRINSNRMAGIVPTSVVRASASSVAAGSASYGRYYTNNGNIMQKLIAPFLYIPADMLRYAARR